MSTWYKTSKWDTTIVPVVVVHATAKQLVIMETASGRPRERKTGITTQYANYHPTWEAAHAYLIDQHERQLKNARTALATAQALLGNVKGMRAPENLKETERQS